MSINVYILTYNRANYLKETIKSVLAQTYKDFSLYVLDNCSSDNTEEVVSSFEDKRMHYIRHSRNIGGGGNINYAIEHCEADYLVVFHDDDLMEPWFLEKEIEAFRRCPDCVVVAGNAEFFGAICGGTVQQLEEGAFRTFRGIELLSTYLKTGHYLVFPSLMYKSSFLKEKHLRIINEPGPCADVVFYCDIGNQGGRICEISDVIMKYRTHDNQDSALHMYPMHIQLFHYLKNNADYQDAFKKEKEGRKSRYLYFSRRLFCDWLNEKVSVADAEDYYNQLAEELSINKTNIWSRLFKICTSHTIAKSICKRLYNTRKQLD